MKQLRTAVMYGTAAVVACTVRICQLLFMTDPQTGFFFPRYQLLGTVLTVFYIAVFAATVAISFIEMKGTVKLNRQSMATSVVLGIAGVFTLSEISFSGSPAMDALKLVLVLGTAAYFICRALPAGKVDANVLRWLALCPCLFWLLQVIVNFAAYMTIANISEKTFDLVAMCVLCLFFLAHGKIANGIGTPKSVRLLQPLGLSASLLCLICSLPRMAANLFGTSPIHDAHSGKLLFIIYAVAVLFLLPVRVKAKSAE